MNITCLIFGHNKDLFWIKIHQDMIQKVEMYQAVCDGCGKCDEAVLKDPYEVKLIAIRWREWEEIDGKLYCPDCVEIDWEERRYEITKTIVHAQVSGPIIPGVDPNPSIAASAKLAVAFADALIAELKKGQENKTGQEKPVQKNHRKTNV